MQGFSEIVMHLKPGSATAPQRSRFEAGSKSSATRALTGAARRRVERAQILRPADYRIVNA
jgi:hypothetical protein